MSNQAKMWTCNVTKDGATYFDNPGTTYNNVDDQTMSYLEGKHNELAADVQRRNGHGGPFVISISAQFGDRKTPVTVASGATMDDVHDLEAHYADIMTRMPSDSKAAKAQKGGGAGHAHGGKQGN